MVIQKHISTRAWLELLLLAIIWGGVFLTAAIALEDIPPFTLVAIRASGAALVLWAVALPARSYIGFALIAAGLTVIDGRAFSTLRRWFMPMGT